MDAFNGREASDASGVAVRNVEQWRYTGVVTPSVSPPVGYRVPRYDLRDVLSIALIGELRYRGVTLQACRLVPPLIRNLETVTGSTLLIFANEPAIIESSEELMSHLSWPFRIGQAPLVIPLGRLAVEVRKDLEALKGGGEPRFAKRRIAARETATEKHRAVG